MQGGIGIASSKRFTAFTLDLPRSRTVLAPPSAQLPSEVTA
jgi:hypothetical protein